MNKRLLSGISALALIITTNIAIAQQRGEPGSSSGAGAPSAAPNGGAASGATGTAPSTSIPERMEPNTVPRTEQPKSDATKGRSTEAPSKGDAKDNKSAGEKNSGTNTKAVEKGDRERSPSGKDADRKSNSAAETERTKEAPNARDRSAVGGDPKADRSQPAGGRVELSGEKRTQVTTVFAKYRTEARQNVNITVNVGVEVPRTVKLFPVPEDIVVLVPEYRRYRYIVVDDRVCIIDPDSFVIVDVIVIRA